jgi:hypothetical protein
VRRLAWFFCLAAACSGEDRLQGDIAERLAQIEGLTFQERPELVPPALAGHRFFHISFTQPVDHEDPDGPTFTQRLTLLHADDRAPVVLYGGGYYISETPTPGRSEPMRMLQGNQITVEHRFFGYSRPDPLDWSKLTIRQGAGDYHRIVEMGKRLFPDSTWIVTGGSKGGETAIFHRRFYPDDVDGTVAYVAPLVLGAPDDRFVPYLRAIGAQPCRDALAAFQREALSTWRPELLQMMSATNYDWEHLGMERALEHAVLELPFALWQYADAEACQDVPAVGASAASAFAFIDTHSRWVMFSDLMLDIFGPYFFQAAVELGYPLIDEAAVSDLLVHPMTDVASVYSPAGVPTSFDATAMQDIGEWVREEGERLMFIYGTNDPWSAAPFELGDAQDSYLYEVPIGNHGANIASLPDTLRAEATEHLYRWARVAVAPGKRSGDFRIPGEPDLVEPRPALGR